MDARNRAALLITLVAAALIIGILFVSPFPGLVDQGDFFRIMDPLGLEYTQEDLAKGGLYFTRVIEDYEMGGEIKSYHAFFWLSISNAPACVVRTLCKMFHVNFSLLYLVGLLSLILLGLTFFVFRAIYERVGGFTYIMGAGTLFVLFSGSYLIWFNSFYQEGCVYLGYLLFLGCSLIAVLNNQVKGLKYLVPVFLSAAFLMGQKVQLISALPVVLIAIVLLIRDKAPGEERGKEDKGREQERHIKSYFKVSCAAVLLIVSMSLATYFGGRMLYAKDTTYQSVFYGILSSDLTTDPRADLSELGLDPVLAQDAGKTAYEPSESYVCPPHSDRAQEMIFDKIGTFNVVRFYLTHPDKLLYMLDYSAHQSYTTQSGFMMYYGVEGDLAVSPKRFDVWDSFRGQLPFNKVFFGYVVQYLLFCGISIWIYIRYTHKGSRARWVIGLYWMNIGIGILQFPLPFLGNGMADTTKQLFLFVLSYDITLLTSALFVLYWLYRLASQCIRRPQVVSDQ